MVRRRFAVLFTASWLAITAAGCSEQYGEAGPPAAGGPEAAGPAVPRTIRIEPGWPTVPELDPGADVRAAKMRIVVTDATDPSRTASRDLDRVERGAVELEMVTTSRVDVAVELRGLDDRLLGFGARRNADIGTGASASIAVAVRKRLVYVSTIAGPGSLRVLGLASAEIPESGLDEPLPAISTLATPAGMYVSEDGLLVVHSGKDAGTGIAEVAVFETASHRKLGSVRLPVPALIAPIGDGHRLLAAPVDDRTTPTATLHVVDADARSAKPLPFNDGAGRLIARGIATSPDGSEVAIAAGYSSSGEPQPVLVLFESISSKLASIDLSAHVDVAQAVRYLPGGQRLVVAGFHGDSNQATGGSLLVFDRASLTAPVQTIALGQDARPQKILVHPDGRHLYVSMAVQYPGGVACCGGLHIVDLESASTVFTADPGGNSPEWDVLSAVRLPYAPHRIIGCQSGQGNNRNGELVDLTRGGEPPTSLEAKLATFLETTEDIATPFGTTL